MTLALMILTFLLAGCGGSARAGSKHGGSSTAESLPGYLSVGTQHFVAFLQWTQTGTSVTGTITADFPGGAGGNSGPISGSIGGSSITLHDPNYVLTDISSNTNTMQGSLSGNTLTLSYPAGDGTINVVKFQRATVTDYNHAVQQLEAGNAGTARATPQG